MNNPRINIQSDLMNQVIHQGARLTEALLRTALDTSTQMGRQLSHLVSASRSGCSGDTPVNLCAPLCCPPKEVCPPHCLAHLTATGHPGEAILVPFAVHNSSSQPRTFQLGLRPLINAHGQAVALQPTLSDPVVAVPPFGTVQAEMRVILTQDFRAGEDYTTEIVLREKAENQNLCVTIRVEALTPLVVVTPPDEQRQRLHFMGWQGHFYCDKHEAGGVAIQPEQKG